ncbi:hypothetical protein FALCPG4_018575 [Fusarium falciforme]
MLVLSVNAAQDGGDSKPKKVPASPDDVKPNEKAKKPHDQEGAMESGFLKPGDRNETLFGELWRRTTSVSNTAKFSGREDRMFVGICKLLQKAVKTHLILSAAKHGMHKDIADLIKRGVSMLLHNNQGETALHLACQKCDVDIVQLLVRATDINLQQLDRRGMTAIHFAARRTDDQGLEVTRVLLEAGAKWTLVNEDDKTPLELATKPETIRLLENPPPVRREFVKRTMEIAVRDAEQEDACKNTLMLVRELNFAPKRDMVRLLKETTIEEVIYGKKPVGEILDEWFSARRPKDQNADQVCQWFHIPTNNMCWVHVCVFDSYYNHNLY